MTCPLCSGSHRLSSCPRWRVRGLMDVSLTAALAAVALAAAGAYALGRYQGHAAGFAELQADWDRATTQQARDYAQHLADLRAQREREVADYQAKEARYATDLLAEQRRAAALADSLRDRPERPAAVPGADAASAPAEGCTGATLYRGDALFLAGEAARADRLRAALDRCQGGDAEPQ